ncbi:Putative nickel-responsive regulator [uncultured archaeon]|nr:Putative nickel-responsive regulator [uncultured archaeon]
MFKYYLVLLSNTMESVSLKLEPNFLNAIEKIMKKHNYMTKAEFIRESIRDKIRRLEEKEILDDKELISQIKISEKNAKKGRIKEFKY